MTEYKKYGLIVVNTVSNINIPVQTISNDKCWLFLWAKQETLPEAFNMIEKWQFNYLRTICWEKTTVIRKKQYGFLGHAEFAVAAYNKIKPDIRTKLILPTVFSAKNGIIKPKKFYSSIKHLSENRCELFCDKIREGWDYWNLDKTNINFPVDF